MQHRDGPGSDDVALDMAGLMRALWRAKIWIVPLVVLGAGATYAGLSVVPPRYKTEAKVLIEPRDPVGGTANSARAPEAERAMLDQEGVASQVQLMSSRDLARRVVADLDFVHKPEFTGAGFLRDLLAAVGLAKDPMRASPEERLVESFFEHATISQVEKSRVISVEFSSRDPELAAKAANAIVREYMKLQAEAKLGQTNDTTKWLEAEIEQLRRKVADAEAKVEQYRTGAELFVGQNNAPLPQQQLGELSSQLTAAQGLKSDSEAKVRQLKLLVAGGSLESATEILNSPLFQRLRERQIGMRSRIAELRATYLPGHPMVQGIEAQIADIDLQIRAEARKILASVESDARVADQRVKELTAQMGEFKTQSARANEQDIPLRAFEREAKAQRDLLETFLGRYREAVSRQSADALPADARVISEATTPVKPYFPKTAPITAVVALALLLLLSTGVVLGELASGGAVRPVVRRFEPRSAAESEPLMTMAASTPPPSAFASALQPNLDHDAADPADEPRRFGARDSAPEPAAARGHDDPQSNLALVWARIEADSDVDRRVVVVSAKSDRAAASAALSLARAGSAGGAKICLIDMVGRLHALAEDAPSGMGLSELIAGHTTFADVIFRDRGSRVHIMPVGVAPLGAEQIVEPIFATVIDALSLVYDHVVIDAGRLNDTARAVLATAGSGHIVLAAEGDALDAETEMAYDQLLEGRARGVSTLLVAATQAAELGGAADSVAA